MIFVWNTLNWNDIDYSLKYSSVFTECIRNFRYADQILIGDEVLAQENNAFTPVKVTDISSLTMQGKFSCYFSSTGHVWWSCQIKVKFLLVLL